MLLKRLSNCITLGDKRSDPLHIKLTAIVYIHCDVACRWLNVYLKWSVSCWLKLQHA